MLVSDFDFDLPDDLIAQDPPAERGGSRLLVLDSQTGTTDHRMFSELPDRLRSGDLLVLNNTRVFPARLIGRRVPSGGAVECLLLSPVPGDPGTPGTPGTPGAAAHVAAVAVEAAPDRLRTSSASMSRDEFWTALVYPSQKLKPGAAVVFARDGHTLVGEVLSHQPSGARVIRLSVETGRVADAIEQVGHIPLPPYITRDDNATDRDRYQTVFARHPGSIAAPTAGLHFTGAILDAISARGVETAEVTLHVGYGTFKPVRVNEVEQHEVDPESYEVTADAAVALGRARREGRRIIAVGTTSARVLESVTIEADGTVRAESGVTRAFIYPGHRFRLVNGLVTNFHLPRSSLLMLVSALGGRERVLNAYREAVARQYRFYSYGDAMLIV